ncbi:hypothetical protein NGB36_07695 [Streptomyces sp. RB6PN25]|uniref:Integral membrane protein n=1 Tax=Streptomyces humicola TaxID=2953240 RepID=A0ABT1PS35_9ACTN|nr:rhomboid-like protein [Streptomyces humicola]MCQ4080487.1 hypothetical protein [Streptomyces humicola]
MIRTFLAVVVAWYVLKAAGRHVPCARRLVVRCSPWTVRLHTWVLSAPATFCYIAVFTCFTLVQKTAPPRLVDIMTAVDSTNLDRLQKNAPSVLATSAFWVANHGEGLALYVIGFATVVAWAEHRYGTPRIVVIAVSGHIFGSLITEELLRHAILVGRAPAKLAFATDVGVSYMLVAGLAAAVLIMSGRTRIVATVLLLGVLLTPMVVSHSIWDLGHVIAALCGLVTAVLCRLSGPLRRPPQELSA